MKCPTCNSSRMTTQVVDDEDLGRCVQLSCARCGYINKRKIDETFK